MGPKPLQKLRTTLGPYAPTWVKQTVDGILRRVTENVFTEIEIEHPAVSFEMLGSPVEAHNWKDYPENRCHEPIVTQAVVDVLTQAEDPVFWDVGSVQGYFPMVATTVTGQPEAIHVFEGDAGNVERIERNNRAYAGGAWTVNRTLVGAGDGGTLRLDTYAPDRPPTLIKIDVNGAEDEVLAGMEGLKDGTLPAVLLELHRWEGYEPRREQVRRFLSGTEYDLLVCERHREAGASWTAIDGPGALPGPEGPYSDYMLFCVPPGSTVIS